MERSIELVTEGRTTEKLVIEVQGDVAESLHMVLPLKSYVIAIQAKMKEHTPQ